MKDAELKAGRVNSVPITKEELDKFEWQLVRDGYYTFLDNNYFSISADGKLYYTEDYTAVDFEFIHQVQDFNFVTFGNELQLK